MSHLALLSVLLLTLPVQAEPPLRDEVNALSLMVVTRVVDKADAPLAVALGLFDGKPCTQYDPSLTQNEPLILELSGTSARTKGPVVFALTQEGDLSGVWSYTPSERTSRWDGKKLAKSTLTCPKPKRNPEQ